MSKNSSTAPPITIFISKNSQATLIHDLPLQLCPIWPLFVVKGTYKGVQVRTFFKGVSTTRLFSKCFLAEMRKKIRPGLPRQPAKIPIRVRNSMKCLKKKKRKLPSFFPSLPFFFFFFSFFPFFFPFFLFSLFLFPSFPSSKSYT